ncbi:MAG: PQQ-binding-like beta-propeller repeat protein [Dokdonella sp.]
MKTNAYPKRTIHISVRATSGALPLALGLMLMGGATAASASTPIKLEEIQRIVPGYFTADTVDLPKADFDGDGKPDVALLGRGGDTDVLQIMGLYAGSGWMVKQIIVPVPDTHNFPIEKVFAWDDADGAHLVFMAGNAVNAYSGWPLALERQFTIGSVDVTDAAIGNIDKPGGAELFTASYQTNRSLRAYSLTTGNLLWTIPNVASYNSSLLVAQLDADPAEEIVLGGTPGLVIDASTHAIEWQYKDGFGPVMSTGRYGGSSPRFASIEYHIVVFQSQPWSPLWDFENISAETATSMDVDGDGVDELIFGSDIFPRGIRVADVQSQVIRTTFDDQYFVQLASADFDGDGQAEIAIGEGSYYYPFVHPDNFRVLDAETGATEFAIPALAPGAYIAGGFIAGPDGNDLIFGSNSGIEYQGTITRVDSVTGTVRWRTLANDPTLNLTQVRDLLVTHISGQTEPTILASGFGDPFGNGRIAAVDSGSGLALWTIDSTNSPIPENVSISGIAAIDIDGDSKADSVLACTSESKLRQFDMLNQSQQWASITMSGDCEGSMQMTTGGRKQLVAVLSSGLRAYDAETHLLSWSLPIPVEINGARFIPHGENGAEIAVFSKWTINFFDAETRAHLRELSYVDMQPIQGISQAQGSSIHELVVAINNKLHLVDGATGELKASTEPLGFHAGQFNQIATGTRTDGSIEIGIGSDVAAFTYRLDGRSDAIFANGFDSASP